MKWIFPFISFVGGVAIAIQAQINGGLGKKTGALEAAFISFSIGSLALFFLVLFFGKGNLGAIFSVPKWQLLGGLLGALYVSIMVIVVPKIGVAPTMVAVIAGQLIIGALIDHFGLFGGKTIPIDTKKIIAIILLFTSVLLFQKK
ncbi:DMT family transporter [Paenibacillus sp. BSR1-1]|uniref:DMT family transporter n=1 Tax=Paenibacillus sp. BSR1-1 TaxID=3020845 RepID=UPI0025B178D9|nr:DMT family transporter [Paenibacillus sp. BSR1-1]MDN3016990.1 DMT family transporter [Paenibacillus sp. BSR1-1]